MLYNLYTYIKILILVTYEYSYWLHFINDTNVQLSCWTILRSKNDPNNLGLFITQLNRLLG